MGLDVYLYTKAQEETRIAFDAKWDVDNEEAGYSTWDQAKKDVYWAEYNALPSHEEVLSTQFPGNINNRRYLRSSYNASGFNSVVPEATGEGRFSYYEIFGPLGDLDQYVIKVEDPGLVAQCRKNALECITALEAIADGDVYFVDDERAIPLRPDLTDGPPTKSKALELFKAEREKMQGPAQHPWGGSYSNAFGSFWLEKPLEVVAALPGIDILGSPCVHMVYRTKLDASYLESAKVLVEFCDELNDLIAKDGCAYLHWSG